MPVRSIARHRADAFERRDVLAGDERGAVPRAADFDIKALLRRALEHRAEYDGVESPSRPSSAAPVSCCVLASERLPVVKSSYICKESPGARAGLAAGEGERDAKVRRERARELCLDESDLLADREGGIEPFEPLVAVAASAVRFARNPSRHFCSCSPSAMPNVPARTSTVRCRSEIQT